MERAIEILRLIRIALTGTLFERCQHQYDIHSTVRVVEHANDEVPIYRKYILKCRHCGEMKVFKA